MQSFKGYINENLKELIKISVAVDPKNSVKFEALLKKMVFGYNGPMDQSRYDKLGLDEFIIVGPSTPVMKWVSKNKSMIIKLAKLPMPKITFASVDVNQYGGENLFEAIDHPAYINVILQDFAKHMKRIKPHAKKAGTKLTVQGKDVRVDGLATAIKKMFDFMTSDGKGFYEEVEQSISEASALDGINDIVKTKGAKKVSGVMVDMFTASMIQQVYNKVNDANKKKMEKANVQTLVQIAQKVMGMK